MSHLSAAHLFRVDGLVAVITGGGSGLGLMIARALDANGAAAIYIVGRRKEALEAAAAQAVNGKIIPVVGDVSSKESLTAVAQRVREEQGFINVLFANSGITGPKVAELLPGFQERKPSAKEFAEAMFAADMTDFTQAFHLNCTAVFYSVLAFLELLDAGNRKGNVTQRSQVVVTSSIAAFNRTVPLGFAYSCSKSAVIHLGKQLCTYFGEYKIRVNALAPGLYPSEMTQNSPGTQGTDGKQSWEEGGASFKISPLERTGSEEDMAGNALFLASRAGAFINGNALITDGGRLGQLPSSY